MPYCASCGHELSDRAPACPQCGHPTATAPAPADPPPVADLRPLDIGEIVDVSIKIYLRHFVTLAKLVAVVVVPLQLFAAFVQASAVPEPLAGMPFTEPQIDPQDPFPFTARDLAVFVVAMVVGTLIQIVGQQLATGASLKAVSEAYLGRRPDWRTSLRFALARLLPLLWVALLATVLLGVAVGVWVLPALAAGWGAGSVPLAVVFGIFGGIGAVASGAWLFVSWSLAVPALLLEDIRGWGALVRSYRLVRGRWWMTFAVLILAYIVAMIVQSIIGGIFGFALPAATDSLLAAFLSGAVGNAIAAVLTTPFLAAVIAVLYVDLRVRKEGFDLELLARQVGEAPGDLGPGDPWRPS